jgi:dienelactone hydrolase
MTFMPKGLPIILAALSALSLLNAADWEAEARRLRPADHNVADDAVVRNLAGRMKIALDSVPRSTDRLQADKARPALRRALQQSLGYKRLPWPPDLQARTVSTLQRDGYRIEKVVFQGLPGEWIPAHLYVPDRLAGRTPGVLFYNGHWFPDSKSRPDVQAFCINMAKLGFVVLDYETFGQGERGLSWRDHRRSEGLLAGIAQQGFAVYDTQVALEYLLTRKEVDAKRIGMTGGSGGGFNTWINTALDDRIKVAVPVVGTCNLYEQAMARIDRDWDPSDHCHYVPGFFRYANNHEFAAMAAPKPVLVVSATEDKSFPIRGVHEVVDYARRLYSSYGEPEHFGYSEDSTEAHGYQIKKREAAYGWFLRWLMNQGDGRPRPEPAAQTLPFDSPELRCFLPGGNQGAGAAMVAAVSRLAADPVAGARELDLSKVLGRWPRPVHWSPVISKVPLQRLVMPIEPDLQVPMILLRPAENPKGLLVAIDDRGKESALSDSSVHELTSAGWAVLGVDPRGLGELASTHKTWVFAISLMMGENLVWRQSWDVLSAAMQVNASPTMHAPRIALYARGHNASLAASYLIGHTSQAQSLKLSWFVLRDGFVTWRDFLERPKSMPLSVQLITSDQGRTQVLDREIPYNYMAYDIAGHFDIPQLLSAPGVPGLVVNPINGDWERRDQASTRKLLTGKVKLVSNDNPDAAILRFASAASRP